MLSILFALGSAAVFASATPVKRDAPYVFKWAGDESQCLNVQTSTTGPGPLVGLSPCQTKDATYSHLQSWTPTEGGAGLFALGTGGYKCLSYDAGATAAPWTVTVDYCADIYDTDMAAQQFNFEAGNIIVPDDRCLTVNTTRLTDSPKNPQGFPATQYYLYVKDCTEGDVEQQWTEVGY